MEIVLTTRNSNELLKILPNFHVSFTVLAVLYPKAKAISWNSLSKGSSCVIGDLIPYVPGSKPRTFDVLDGIWFVDVEG